MTIARRLLAELRRDGPFYVFVLVALVTMLFVKAQYELPAFEELSYSADWLLTIAFIYISVRVISFLIAQRFTERRSLLSVGVWRDLSGGLLRPERVLNLVLILVSVRAIVAVFAAFKASIPLIEPFAWDATFAAWDRLLHFGRHPWVWIHPVVGHPIITWILDKVYVLWFPLVWTTFVWQAWHGDPRRRSQFLVAFAACWLLLGGLAAVLLSSAGPVYYHLVTDEPSPYLDLVRYLLAVDAEGTYRLRAVWAHDFLWRNMSIPGTAEGEGISAMPSMHISMVFLTVLVTREAGRGVRWFYAAFAGIIFVGSIALAWHYAIDAYVAVAGTLAIWWASGRAVSWWERISE